MGTIYYSVRDGLWHDPYTWSPQGIPGDSIDDIAIIRHRIRVVRDIYYTLKGIALLSEDGGRFPSIVFEYSYFYYPTDVRIPTITVKVKPSLSDSPTGGGIYIEYSPRHRISMGNYFFLVASNIVYYQRRLRVRLLFVVELSDFAIKECIINNWTSGYLPYVPLFRIKAAPYGSHDLVTAEQIISQQYLFLTEGSAEFHVGVIYSPSVINVCRKIYDSQNIYSGETIKFGATRKVRAYVESADRLRLRSTFPLAPAGLALSWKEGVNLRTRRSPETLPSSSPISAEERVTPNPSMLVDAFSTLSGTDGALLAFAPSLESSADLQGGENVTLAYTFPQVSDETSLELVERVTPSAAKVVKGAQSPTYSTTVGLSPTFSVSSPQGINYNENVTSSFGATDSANILYSTSILSANSLRTIMDTSLPQQESVSVQRPTNLNTTSSEVEYSEKFTIEGYTPSISPLPSASIVSLIFTPHVEYITDSEGKELVNLAYGAGGELQISSASPLTWIEEILYPNLTRPLVEAEYLEFFDKATVTKERTFSVASLSPLISEETVTSTLPLLTIESEVEITTTEAASLVLPVTMRGGEAGGLTFQTLVSVETSAVDNFTVSIVSSERISGSINITET